MSFIAAIQFLTSIPLATKRELAPEQLGRATAFFPLVGLIIGGALALFNWLLSFILPPAITGALLIVILTLISGAMHLDGLADTCDGMAGHKPVEERWRIMRDSRSGAFGVVGIVVVLLVKYAGLVNLPEELIYATLVFMPVVSRWAMVYALFTFRYARPQGLGTAFKQATRWPQFTLATVFTLIIAAALFPLFSFMGFILVAGVLVLTTLLAFYFRSKFAGLTGDTYGAINEVAETAALLMAIAVWTGAGN